MCVNFIYLGTDKVRFYLDKSVKYSDEYYNYIDCFNDNRLYVINFNIIDVGDCVEVNWCRSEDYNGYHVFTNSDNLRSIRFQQALHNYSVAPQSNLSY